MEEWDITMNDGIIDYCCDEKVNIDIPKNLQNKIYVELTPTQLQESMIAYKNKITSSKENAINFLKKINCYDNHNELNNKE